MYVSTGIGYYPPLPPILPAPDLHPPSGIPYIAYAARTCVLCGFVPNWITRKSFTNRISLMCYLGGFCRGVDCMGHIYYNRTSSYKFDAMLMFLCKLLCNFFDFSLERFDIIAHPQVDFSHHFVLIIGLRQTVYGLLKQSAPSSSKKS